MLTDPAAGHEPAYPNHRATDALAEISPLAPSKNAHIININVLN